jgi:FlaA1/EpsC-like NDP-sugar epimerase
VKTGSHGGEGDSTNLKGPAMGIVSGKTVLLTGTNGGFGREFIKLLLDGATKNQCLTYSVNCYLW